MKNAVLFILLFSACIAGFSLFFKSNVFSQDEEEFEIQLDRKISFDFRSIPIQGVCDFFVKEAGLNIVLQAGIAEDFDEEEITVTMKLRNVPLVIALETLAEYLHLAVDIRPYVVFFKWRPEINEENIIGELVLEGDDFELSLNIYEGEITHELKKRLIFQIVEQRERNMHVLWRKMDFHHEEEDDDNDDEDDEFHEKREKMKKKHEKMKRQKLREFEQERINRELF